MSDLSITRAATTLLALRPTATMDDIAEAAGVSRATLFRRFPTRQTLVVELSRLAVEHWLAALDAADPERDAAPEALRRVVVELARIAPEYGLLVLQPLDDFAEAELLDRAKAATDRFVALVRRGQAAGEFRVDLPAEWIDVAVQWLVVGAADGLRLGRLAPNDVERLLGQTVLGFVTAGPR